MLRYVTEMKIVRFFSEILINKFLIVMVLFFVLCSVATFAK